MSDEREWYADKGYVRGGFYDEMGGMLVGVRAQDIANRLNELAELREALAKYGEHRAYCETAIHKPCDCGLRAALQEKGK